MEESQNNIQQVRKAPWYTLITSPGMYFGSRKDRVPWLWPLIISSVVSLIAVIVELPSIMKMPQMQTALGSVPAGTQGIVQGFARGSSIIGGLIGPWFSVFVGAVILWLIMKLFGVTTNYMNVVGVLANAYIISVIGVVLTAVIVISTGTLPLGFLSLNEIFKVSGGLAGLLAKVSIFWLWHIYVTTVGVSETGGVSRGRALGPVLVVALLGLLLALASGASAAGHSTYSSLG